MEMGLRNGDGAWEKRCWYNLVIYIFVLMHVFARRELR